MSRHSARPQLEQLGDRCLPSAGPALSIIGHVALPEGSGGRTAFVFRVNLSRASSHQVSVKFATADGTATVADHDYVRTAGRLTFAPGETAKTITVLVKGDTVVEPDETFFVKLGGARNASIAHATGVGTILNDDVVAAAPVAVDDSNTTPQYTPVGGNVLANDASPLSGAMTVSTVNGSAANVGKPIALASGALLTVNADGSYTYDPNGYLLPFLFPEQTATDSFTYTAANVLGVQSNTATVTITIVSALPSQPGNENPDPGDNPYG
jgi:VCBS repeat-containing protein